MWFARLKQYGKVSRNILYADHPSVRRFKRIENSEGQVFYQDSNYNTPVCTGCFEPVMPKLGDVVRPHWSHINKLCSFETEPKSEWHLNHQNRFSPDKVEIVIGDNRADGITNSNVVVELQASGIEQKQILNRENAYRKGIIFGENDEKLAYNPLWILNCPDSNVEFLNIRCFRNIDSNLKVIKWSPYKSSFDPLLSSGRVFLDNLSIGGKDKFFHVVRALDLTGQTAYLLGRFVAYDWFETEIIKPVVLGNFFAEIEREPLGCITCSSKIYLPRYLKKSLKLNCSFLFCSQCDSYVCFKCWVYGRGYFIRFAPPESLIERDPRVKFYVTGSCVNCNKFYVTNNQQLTCKCCKVGCANPLFDQKQLLLNVCNNCLIPTCGLCQVNLGNGFYLCKKCELEFGYYPRGGNQKRYLNTRQYKILISDFFYAAKYQNFVIKDSILDNVQSWDYGAPKSKNVQSFIS